MVAFIGYSVFDALKDEGIEFPDHVTRVTFEIAVDSALEMRVSHYLPHPEDSTVIHPSGEQVLDVTTLTDSDLRKIATAFLRVASHHV